MADFKIVIGQVDPHQFVGFTGGSKGAVIGCAAAETIEKNHSLMSEADARVGRLRGNPVREDLNEAGEMVGIDFAVNLVLDADKKAVHLAAGKPMAVLESCAATCAEVYGVGIAEKLRHRGRLLRRLSQGHLPLPGPEGAEPGLPRRQARRPHPAAGGLAAGGGRRHLFRLRVPVHHAGGGDPGFQIDRASAWGRTRPISSGEPWSTTTWPCFPTWTPGVLRKCHLRAADPATIVAEWVAAFDGTPRLAIIPNANTTYFYRIRCKLFLSRESSRAGENSSKNTNPAADSPSSRRASRRTQATPVRRANAEATGNGFHRRRPSHKEECA